MSGSLFTLAMARLVLKMLGGELIPYTKFDGLIANRLMDEGIITIVPRGSKRSFRMIDPEGCRIYISQNYTSGMELEDWILFMANHVCFLPCKALLFSCRITNISVFLKML